MKKQTEEIEKDMKESIDKINDPDSSIQTVAKVTIKEKKNLPVPIAEQSPDELTGKATTHEALSDVLSRVNVDDGEDLISSFISSTKPGEEHETNAWMSTEIEGL